MPDTREQSTTIVVRGWFGRTASLGSVTCTTAGYREATWRRDPDLGWIEEHATLRPVIGWRADDCGDWRPVLGEPRNV